MNRLRLITPLLLVPLSLHCLAGVPSYDFRQPQKDGVVLVGMECHHKNLTLELGVFYPSDPPSKRMDLWNTADLVKFNPETSMVQDIFTVEKRCTLGADRYKVQLKGVPGAANAMSRCGASTGVHASVWKNGQAIFDEDLERCNGDSNIKKLRFEQGADLPAIERRDN
ncbi:hypothetical protein [Massilia sp. erpn]|uniref:hypothetical protein n=1 Tax=Massilia sp. erpn TaxID=2738142 RepID=UPI0021065469|nr:hypothetical protein [Massilia sp. erpn]UTY59966.1 hypothetical protein HPQ68_23920 [Massilia sp. erpn]